MVEKPYDWAGGADLQEHSRRKHKILRDYLGEYLRVRCQLPMQSRFRLAVVEGFAGGGRYTDGSPGSPIVFLEEIKSATERLNISRSVEGMGPIEIELLLILNDNEADAIAQLRSRIASVLGVIEGETPRLSVEVQYLQLEFEIAYPKVKDFLRGRGFERNILFNLDPCGYSDVKLGTILDILNSYRAAEIFYTFPIQSLTTFLRRHDQEALAQSMAPFGLEPANLDDLDQIVSKKDWLGAAERLVFDAFKRCSRYTSPFSINNPDGWRYWLMHFANSYRARQVYNDVLHRNSSCQAHFGRSGLRMLSFDPREEGSLYLFRDEDRSVAVEQLTDDIPRLLANSGDAIPITELYQGIYNETPAHSDDVHDAIMRSPDLSVLTPSGNERRKPNTINAKDVLKLRDQRSFFPTWGLKPSDR